MRLLLPLLLFALAAHATDPVPDDEAKEALDQFDKAFKATKVVEEKQNLVFNLFDVPNDLVIDRLAKLALKDRDPAIRNVAALALGGQKHNVDKAGKVLQQVLDKQAKHEEVLASVLEAMVELTRTHPSAVALIVGGSHRSGLKYDMSACPPMMPA